MKTKTTVLAALLFAGASQAALAQDHDHGDRTDRPAAQGHATAPAAVGHAAVAPAPAPSPGPHVAPIAPQGGHARFGAPPPPSGPPAIVASPSHGGDRHFDRGGDHNSFAPGGTAPGDRHWDRRDVPREVVPPTNAEHGWDREHDGHAADGRRLDHVGRDDGRLGDHNRGDHRGPPANWRHWERGQFPPIFSAPHRFRVGPYRPPYGWYVRSWGFGDFLPRGWYGQSFWIDDFYDYDLPYPPPGMHWVRVGDDVMLVDDYSGRIVQIIRDMFW